MDVCYCANYYSYIKCTNTVGMFGDRCRLCVVLRSGRPLTPGMLPEDLLWLTALPSYTPREEPPPMERPDGSSVQNSSAQSSNSSASWLSAWGFGRRAHAPFTKTSSTRATGGSRNERRDSKSW